MKSSSFGQMFFVSKHFCLHFRFHCPISSFLMHAKIKVVNVIFRRPANRRLAKWISDSIYDVFGEKKLIIFPSLPLIPPPQSIFREITAQQFCTHMTVLHVTSKGRRISLCGIFDLRPQNEQLLRWLL